MYEFEKDLMLGETILYEGKPVPGKAKKNVGGLLVFVILCILIILVWAVVNKFGDDAYIMNAKPFFLGLIFMCGLGICQNIYNVFFKNNKIKDEYYCITNLRVMKYNKKKNKLRKYIIISKIPIESNFKLLPKLSISIFSILVLLFMLMNTDSKEKKMYNKITLFLYLNK